MIGIKSSASLNLFSTEVKEVSKHKYQLILSKKGKKNQIKVHNYMKEIISTLLVIFKDFANSSFYHPLPLLF